MEVVFRAAESHDGWTLVSNSFSAGWKVSVPEFLGSVKADVEWSLSLSVCCKDGSRVSGSWGPYRDGGVVLEDGREFLRDCSQEFKALRKEFSRSHRNADADRLAGDIVFRVSFPDSPFLVAGSAAVTLGEIAGMVEASSQTTSADGVLRYFIENASKFYKNLTTRCFTKNGQNLP